MADLGAQQIDELLAQTQRTLAAMRSREPARAEPDDAEAVGEAADGRVRATVRAGDVASLWLDPRMMRLPSEELCELIVHAVNAALAESRTHGDGTPATVDPQALAERLDEVRDASVRQMAAFSEAMTDVLARIRSARQ